MSTRYGAADNHYQMNASLLTDGYKLDHRRQYPVGTEYVYANWTPRSNGYMPDAKDGAVVFGIQYFIKKYLIDRFNNDFFNLPEDVAVAQFKRRVDTFLGKNEVGLEHIRELHRLGYLPIRLKALPEGSICPIRVPMITVINTNPKFFWLTNFLETIMSCELWLPMTSATSSRLYRKELERHAEKTGFTPDVNLGFLCHDFSMRGMAGLEAAITSGMGHLTSFVGSETLPAIEAVEKYYNANAEKEIIAMTVPASEHSVMCAGGKEDEFETFKRFITEIYPSGFCSIVSDTWDLWQVVTDYLPRLKDIIMARDGRLVIRPDSGNPVDIICGLPQSTIDDMSFEELDENKAAVTGVYELLWNIFGGTVNEKGYKVLDPHIGVIYGDSITRERQKEIYRRLEAKGFAATNLVLGVGSFTFQYVTRDCLGFAMKATWCQVNGEPREIFKSPKTDSGMKKSLKGLIRIDKDQNGIYYATDCVTPEQEAGGCLEVVFEDGKLIKETSFNEIRERLCR